MAGAFFNVYVYHIPAGLLLIAIVITNTSMQSFFSPKKTSITWSIYILFIIFMIQIITGRGFTILGSGGYVLIYAYVFQDLFLTGAGPSVKRIVHGITFIYKFFIVGMIIEFIIIILGKQSLLAELFYSTVAPNYKTYNQADVARFLGFFQESGGLNSVLIGSQIAGMLSLFAAIWFMYIKMSGISVSKKDRYNLWFIISFLMLILTINGTVFLLLCLAIIIHVLFIHKKHRILSLCVISLAFVGFYFLASAGYFLPRIFGDTLISSNPGQLKELEDFGGHSELVFLTTWEFYIYIYTLPVVNFISSGLVNILIGVGAQYFRTTTDYVSGDFGFGYSMLASGLIWMVTLVAALFITCFTALRLVASGSNDQKLWSVLGSINGLITLLWLFSTVHYNQAFANPGGMMLFALHIALTAYCRKRYSSIS